MKLNPLGMRAVFLTAALGIIPAHAVLAQQYVGVSHPEQVPVSVSPDGIAQPVVYESGAASELPPSAPTTVTVSAPAASSTVVVVPSEPVHEQTTVASAQQEPAPVLYSHQQPAFDDAAPRAGDDRHHDEDGQVVTRIIGPADTLPQGSLLKARMLVTLSTEHTTIGAPWSAELTAPLERDGRVLIPAGSVLSGKVSEVHGGRRISGQASIHLVTLSIMLPDGMTLGLHAQVIDSDSNRELRVDDEGTLLHREHRKEEAGVLALTAGSGAAAGGILAGVPGAIVGASLGAGVSTALWLREDRQAELPKDTVVTFELQRPLLAISR